MKNTSDIQCPIRAGIFDSLRQADEAVDELLTAGFTKDQITVICSEPAAQRHFEQFEHQDPAGTDAPGRGTCRRRSAGPRSVVSPRSHWPS